MSEDILVELFIPDLSILGELIDGLLHVLSVEYHSENYSAPYIGHPRGITGILFAITFGFYNSTKRVIF